MKSLTVEAPSNIALIKYMGKVDASQNFPTNASLSWTLNHLITRVKISESNSAQDGWSLLKDKDLISMSLSEKGKTKFLNHWQRCKNEFGISDEKKYLIESANNFPADCGLASSASSFAALTLAAFELAKSLDVLNKNYLREDLALIAKKGSGSSCRSFFSPWCEWQGESVKPIVSHINKLKHLVLIADDGVKTVSSSEAHKRVSTSSLFFHRPARAQQRLTHLKKIIESSLTQEDLKAHWSTIFEICWSEFWDMHALFETSNPSFGYMNSNSLLILNYYRNQWSQNFDGPLITMDAGPNVHALYREDQMQMLENDKLWMQNKVNFFSEA